eukprot:2303491-Amphidinium_carterae.1
MISPGVKKEWLGNRATQLHTRLCEIVLIIRHAMKNSREQMSAPCESVLVQKRPQRQILGLLFVPFEHRV